MELYEQIRREYEFGVGSVIVVARKPGVHRRVLRCDNLTSAVKKILRGQQRELTARFIAFRLHWQ